MQRDPRPVFDEGLPIHRFEVPVNDEWCSVAAGPPLHVDCRQPGVVEFWARPAAETHDYLVIGTGHPVPAPVIYWGTALDGGFVWHLVERLATATAVADVAA